MRINLEDLIQALNKEFEIRYVQGKVNGRLNRGIFTIIVKDVGERLRKYLLIK